MIFSSYMYIYCIALLALYIIIIVLYSEQIRIMEITYVTKATKYVLQKNIYIRCYL
jgi:hypothetical protein